MNITAKKDEAILKQGESTEIKAIDNKDTAKVS